MMLKVGKLSRSSPEQRMLCLLLPLVLAFSSLGGLTLCTHEDHARLETSWAPCCASEPRGEDAGTQGPDEGPAAERHDDCDDIVLAGSLAWTPEAQPASWVPAWVAATGAAGISFDLQLWPVVPVSPRTSPPRRRIQTVVLRC